MTSRSQLIIRLVLCLVLACVISYTFLLLPSSSQHSRTLAEDALLAACDSVQGAKLSLFETLEDELRTVFRRNARDRLDTKLERLQTYLDNLHQKSDSVSLGELSGPGSTEWYRAANTNHVDVCGSLAGKRITMIGGEHVYRLHLLLLRDREHAEKKLYPCPYHEFCTHHHVCLPSWRSQDDTLPPRYIKSPTTQELIETKSVAVNYIVSDTLLSTLNESHWAYALPYVDPLTGVRLREAYWLSAARKANVVIIGRGPLSAPGSTYTRNWSFLRRIPDYVDQSRVVGARGDHGDEVIIVPRSLEILNVAVHLTVSRFLPDLFHLLQSIRREVRPGKRKPMIWPSSWYRVPDRGAGRTAFRPRVKSSTIQQMLFDHDNHSFAERVLVSQLSAFIDADVLNTVDLEDPWTLLFNAQVYLQNMVLREVLPRYGIVFLPLNVPWVEGDKILHLERGRLHGHIELDDWRRVAVGEAFLTGTDYILRYLQ